MKKEKYVYNPKSLTYERHKTPLSHRLLRTAGLAVGVLGCSLGLLMLFLQYGPSSPKEQSLLREIDQMKIKYSSISEQLNLMEKVLYNIQDRDANVHRMVFGMEPINEDVWNAGVGGHDRFGDVTNYQNSGALLFNTLERADKLARQLALQSRSLDSLELIAGENEKFLNSMPSVKPIRTDQVKRSIRYLSGFGMRLHPIHKIPKMHYGLDFTAHEGTPVRVTGDGKVVKVRKARTGYGNHVVVDHGFGYKTLYAHLEKIEVKKGEKLTKGEPIGTVGSTGTSTAPHLHYEVHYKDKPVNPIHYCMDGLSPKEYEEMVKMASETNKSFD